MHEKYHEIKINLYLLKDLTFESSLEEVGNLLNYSFEKSKYMGELHKRSGLKHYSFSGLYPIEKDRTYKSDEIYIVTVRTYNDKIKDELITCLNNLHNEQFVVTGVEIKQWKNKIINYVDTLTPMMITMNNGRRWNMFEDDIKILTQGVFNNLTRKYNELQGIKMKINIEDVIESIELRNKIPISINYKGFKMWGYKTRVKFKDNNIAQDIANVSVVEGIGEKNSSIGMGFTKPYFKVVNRC